VLMPIFVLILLSYGLFVIVDVVSVRSVKCNIQGLVPDLISN